MKGWRCGLTMGSALPQASVEGHVAYTRLTRYDCDHRLYLRKAVVAKLEMTLLPFALMGPLIVMSTATHSPAACFCAGC